MLFVKSKQSPYTDLPANLYTDVLYIHTEKFDNDLNVCSSFKIALIDLKNHKKKKNERKIGNLLRVTRT